MGVTKTLHLLTANFFFCLACTWMFVTLLLNVSHVSNLRMRLSDLSPSFNHYLFLQPFGRICLWISSSDFCPPRGTLWHLQWWIVSPKRLISAPFLPTRQPLRLLPCLWTWSISFMASLIAFFMIGIPYSSAIFCSTYLKYVVLCCTWAPPTILSLMDKLGFLIKYYNIIYVPLFIKSLLRDSNFLVLAEWSYNTFVHSSTSLTFYEVTYGKALPSLP